MKGGLDEYHEGIVRVVPPVLEQDGFALAGGNALRAHGLTTRSTQDVNLFSDRERGVVNVTSKVELALRNAGYLVERMYRFIDRTSMFPEPSSRPC
ncbi:MAG TPA: hypothetical protein VGI64_17245 [Streptosporangiaceae bacterium]